MHEPRFRREGGTRDMVLPGNKKFVEGDRLPRSGESRQKGSGPGEGDGEDAFRFVLSRDEFVDLFLDDLELPDLAKRKLAQAESEGLRRAGYTTSGSPANLSVSRTVRLALARRVALKRPRAETIGELEAELADCDEARRAVLLAEIEALKAKIRRIPFIDPIDIRYRRFETVPKPVAQAVMFCLMDVSGSMSEHMKDLAKRFYMLLYVFLTRRYRHVEIVFIRHTDRAEEVDEDTFFHGPASGGTLVSSALEAMHEIVRSRFRPADWNIYAAQASDGDNSNSDSPAVSQLLTEKILPVSQFFAYLEVGGKLRQHLRYAGLLAMDAVPASAGRRRAAVDPQGQRAERDLSGVSRSVSAPAQTRESRIMTATRERLFEGADWDFQTLQRIHDACEEIARSELGLDTYPNQIEVITAEQMLDAYSSVGMPLFYKHWSFGKHFAHQEASYRKGLMGLAYEIVINSSPCISYLMEENTATMQTLVIAHAAFGHNHFFKNNYLFKQWTDADGILDYLDFAKNYISQCEERHGRLAVEQTLDAAHALMSHGIDRYPGKKTLDLRAEEKRAGERRLHEESAFNDLWRTVPTGPIKSPELLNTERRRKLLGMPQENLLYFLEKTAPRLQPWQREVLRIVRHIAQYFYPQSQTKVMNEGTATYVHYRIMTRLHEQGQISDGNFLEFLQSHTNVVFQPDFDDQRFSGFNPYALGFAMMQDIERIVINPDDEDREWFPDIAGTGDAMAVLRDTWANYRDESFISQFLSPRLMRRLRLFHLHDDPNDSAGVLVGAIHNERGYRRVRTELARQYDVGFIDANIEVVDVDLAGDRRLMLRHSVVKGAQLNETDAKRVLQHLADLWSYDVSLTEVDATDTVLREYVASPRQLAAAAA